MVVIGGGNSGVEAAIDLAGIAKTVTLLQRGETLTADQVLQDKLVSLPNVTIKFNSLTTEL
ncbi:alkyl hydroperoxide reductase F52A protein subunit F, partial [gut metagenome]